MYVIFKFFLRGIVLKKFLKKENIIALVHFIATFFLERIIFSFEDNFSVSRLSPISLRFSDNFELVMAYVISKCIALVLIICIWKLIFMMKSGSIPVKTSVIFTILFVVGAVILLFLFPGSFETSGDNYIAYAHAVNFVPDYWFSVYTSCYYAGCMMVFPHPYTIVLVHWLGFVFGLGYVYNRIDRSEVIAHKAKYIVFILFLLPYTLVILTDCYRTELYAVLCLIYASIVMLDIIEHRKRTFAECIVIALVAGLISVWRTEGIVLGAISFIALVIFNYHENVKSSVKKILLFIVIVVIMMLPQKVGDIKYYGNDYAIINLTRPLGMIFNDPDANLTYAGADSDIEAIDTLVPIVYLQEFYLDGYRRRNMAIGGRDINQSMSALEYSDAFVKASYRLILHNPGVYLKTQWNLFNIALGTNFTVYQASYDGPPSYAPDWDYDMWAVGEEIFYSSPFTTTWKNNALRSSVEEVILNLRSSYFYFCNTIRITVGLNVFCVLATFALALFELIRSIINKKADAMLFVLIAMAGQYAAIFLCMPAGITAYFRGIFFTTYIVLLLYPVRNAVNKRKK